MNKLDNTLAEKDKLLQDIEDCKQKETLLQEEILVLTSTLEEKQTKFEKQNQIYSEESTDMKNELNLKNAELETLTSKLEELENEHKCFKSTNQEELRKVTETISTLTNSIDLLQEKNSNLEGDVAKRVEFSSHQEVSNY